MPGIWMRPPSAVTIGLTFLARIPWALMQIEVGVGTHTGLKRAHNEDTFFASDSARLWIVADGMGGLESGEVASAMARDIVVRLVEDGQTLADAIEHAHDQILEFIAENNPAKRMGTTIVALRVDADEFEIAWVGDSRIYHLQDYALKQISRDHSYVQELIDRNLITPEEARHSPHKNLVTQALGAVSKEDLKVATARGTLAPGSQVLLCTDGLTGEVEDQDIEEILLDEVRVQGAVDSLIQAALNGGGNDNITVVLLRAS
jgi:PPM family protein phosphatase